MIYTTLGKYGVWQADGGALSSHMLRSGGKAVVLDMGNGALPKLLSSCALDELGAVVLSHLHHDHISDIFTLDYAMGHVGADKVKLYAPEAPEDMVKLLRSLGKLEYHAVNENSRLDICNMELTFFEVVHPVTTYAIKCVDSEGKTAVYTADTVVCDGLAEFAANSDLLIADACLLEADTVGRQIRHMTPRQTALLAEKAKCKKLILSHLLPTHTDAEYESEAREIFANSFAAQELKAITL